MYLKRIEVSGFKSFADHLKLDFEPGITSVVGPNGCGKSNIIDAIRWCLGEMSAKSLRSNLMMDVVFNGSGSRPPSNLSQVTLTFDNSDKRLPIDYAEVAVGRRLFRSGESEYFLNKSQCRLRDIRELFLDTGMGEDGYSFMAQGKVEWVLSAKPEERRELFEEAAGVSKYRARREEAMRKLERLEIDLSRLADIISVTQDQIRKLENAVSRAKNYQKTREQLKELEIGDWLYQIENGDQNLSEIEQRLSESQKQYESINTEIHTKESEVAQLRLEDADIQEKLLLANNKLNEIESNIKIYEERKVNSLKREEELGQQSTSISNNIHREKGRIQELKDQQNNQQLNYDAILNEGKNIEPDFQAAQQTHNEALKKLETKQLLAKEIRGNILKRSQERNQFQSKLSQLTSSVSRFEFEVESRKKETARLQSHLESLQSQIENINSQSQNFKEQLSIKSHDESRLNGELKVCDEKEISLRQDLLTQSETIASLKGQIESIKGQQSQDPYMAGAQAAIAQHFNGVYGPLSRLIKCSDTDRDLVTSTLGEHLTDLVAESTEAANNVVEFLKLNRKGRARIWILDKLETWNKNSVGEIPRGQKLIEKVNCDIKFRPLISHLFDSLWLQDGIVFGEGFLNGGVDPAHWKSHTLLRLDELENQLEEKEAQKKYLEESVEAAEIEKQGVESKKDSNYKEMETFRVRFQLAEEERKKINELITVAQEELGLIDTEGKQGEIEKNNVGEALTLCRADLVKLDEDEKNDHNQLDLIQHELTELQEIHSKSTAELSAKQERHNSFQQKLSWQANIVDQIKSDLANIEKNILHYEESLNQNARDIEDAKKAQEESKSNIAKFLNDRNQAAETCTQIQNRRTELSTKISELDKSLHEIRKTFEKAQHEMHESQIAQTALKGKLESIHQKLADQYEMTIDQAKTEFKGIKADVEILDKLKKRVLNMGPVNLAAPQEHAELLEKNNFLTSQQNDLTKAKQDLRDVISKINATTREHFRETFHKVRENFRILYSDLFQGGEADLHFTNEADILSTGIDIFCQPPGKKLLHISLMSGGEKALTAVALLFAFFQVRPSPLALLDEVDAPLDEANVTRFVKMVKRFSENSQFILITHNKRTMEAAHSLYGVTMEELGVSKVISTRLVKESKQKEKPPVAEESSTAA